MWSFLVICSAISRLSLPVNSEDIYRCVQVDDATPDKPKDLQGALKAPAVAPSLAAAADSVAVGAAAAQGLAPRGPQSAEEAATLGVQAAVGAQV